MIDFIKKLKSHAKSKRLVAMLSGENRAQVTGLWGTSSRYLVSSLVGEVPGYILFVTSQLEEAEAAFDEISYLTDRKARFFPAWDDLVRKSERLNPEILRGRLSVIQEILSEGRSGKVIVAPVSALMQSAISADVRDYGMFEIKSGQRLKRDEFIEFLAEKGFERVFEVELPGQFSVRGGIVDVFSQSADVPFRIEFNGDAVESIRTFDIIDQISQTSLKSCLLVALKRDEILPLDTKKATSLFDLLPADTLIVYNEISEIERSAEERKRLLPRSDCPFSYVDMFSQGSRFKTLFLSVFEENIRCPEVHFNVKLLPAFKKDAAESFAELGQLRQECRAFHSLFRLLWQSLQLRQ